MVEGDPNLVRGPEILVNKEDKYITLAARDKGDMKSLSDFSSMEERFYNIEIVTPIRKKKNTVRINYNPDTLEKMFSNVPCLSYNSSTKAVKRADAAYFSCGEFFPLQTQGYAYNKTWVDRQEAKNYIESFLRGMTETNSLSPLYPIKLLRISGSMGALFKNGHFKGIIKNSDNVNFDYKDFTSWVITSTENVCYTNNKGEETDDFFGIVGEVVSDFYTIDESYVAVSYPFLFISPLVNGMFVLGTFKGSKDLVLMNCLELDTGHLREIIGMPESMVIPCKEGEYIKYPNMN